MPKFPRMNSWVSRRVRSNQFHLLWWLSMFLVLSCCCSEWWFRPSVTPDVHTTNIWKQIAAHYSFFSQNLLYRGIPVWNDIMDWWFPTSWGLLCFESMKRSSPLDTRFSCFFEISFLGVVLKDEISSIILLEAPTKFSDTGCRFIQSWCNAHILEENCLFLWTSPTKVSLAWKVGCRLASEPTNLNILWWLSLFFGTQMLLLVVMNLAFRDSWCSYHQDLKTNCSSFQLLFQKIWCLAEFQFELMLWIVGFRLDDFFVLNQCNCLPFWIPIFRVLLRWIS